jgi:hypothetical protein
MDRLRSKEKKKSSKSMFKKIFELFETANTTHIPNWLKERRKGDIASKANAATKIIKFASEVKLTQSKLREIYEIERDYEISKIKAREEYPHVESVMLKLISEARFEKMGKMKSVLTKSQFEVYSKMFRKSGQHY